MWMKQARFDLQLFGLPRRQDLAHGDRCIRYMKFEACLWCVFCGGNAPGCCCRSFALGVYFSKLRCDCECLDSEGEFGPGLRHSNTSNQAKTWGLEYWKICNFSVSVVQTDPSWLGVCL
jgi:hypothetical protein